MFTITASSLLSFRFGLVEDFWRLILWLGRAYAWTLGIIKWKAKPESQSEPILSLAPHKISSEQGNEVETSRTTPIFALVIGIDRYLHHGVMIQNLSGCVADANDIAAFLSETLRVPPDNIASLYNEDATADGITAAFESLAKDPRIPKGAVIFIFYAGHGGEALPPKDWPSHDMMQILLPYDFNPDFSGDGIIRNVLPDVRLGQILENIAREKGNNITVIFDCCHSGSSTRLLDDDGVDGQTSSAVRGVSLRGDTRLGNDVFPAPGESKAPMQYREPLFGSHVLLAACTEGQKAQENHGRGAFTSALTALLRNADLTQITYFEIIRRLPKLNRQAYLVFVRINQDHIFLYNHVAGPRRRNLAPSPSQQSGTFVIDAGEIHGVTVGTQFAVYDTTAPTHKLGCLVVYETTTIQSSLRHVEGDQTFKIPDTGAFALQTRIGITRCLRLFINRRSGRDFTDVVTDIRQQMMCDYPSQPSFGVVSTLEEYPDLTVTSKDGVTYFDITDKFGAGLNRSAFRSTSDRETMSKVLRDLANFYWHLHRTPSSFGRPLCPSICFECYELEHTEFNGLVILRPTGDNLCVDGVIRVGVGDVPKLYGFSMTNTSARPLFVSVVYFNMSTFRMTPYYQSPSGGRNVHFSPFLPNTSLTIGYGTSGTSPHSTSLNKGQDAEVGYVKLFVSTEHLNYSKAPVVCPVHDNSRPALWDTLRIPIIHRRVKPETLEMA